MSGRSLQDQVKTCEPPANESPENKTLSTDEDASCKTSSVLWKFLQQQQAPGVDLQSQTKYLAQSKEIKQNWTRLQKFDI